MEREWQGLSNGITFGGLWGICRKILKNVDFIYLWGHVGGRVAVNKTRVAYQWKALVKGSPTTPN